MANHSKKSSLPYQSKNNLLQFLSSKLKNTSLIAIAIWLSILVHAVLLSIHFTPELKRFKDNLPVLEVFLVNAKTSSKPDHTEIFAQANLDRGGNTEQNRQMKTALPATKQQKAEVSLKPTPQAEKNNQSAPQPAEETKEQKQVTALEKQVQELMTQIKSQQKIESKAMQIIAVNAVENGVDESVNNKIDKREMTAAALEMDRLEALISRHQDDYQKRPKRKFIGARTQEYRYAMYVESWRQKVEKIGNLNYPAAVKDAKIYGQLQMTVSIKADGSIENVEINRSSGHKLLDEAAKHIVTLAAPYARFPENVHKETDILSITRTWTFTKEDSLDTNSF